MNRFEKKALLVCLLTGNVTLEIKSESSKNSDYQNMQKFVMGYPYPATPPGMFAAMRCVLNNLEWCERHGRTLVIHWGRDTHSPYYQEEPFNGSTNVWEYYFEPVSNERYVPGDYINYSEPERNLIPLHNFDKCWFMKTNYRAKIKGYLDKYVKIKVEVMKKINVFYDEHIKGKNTIAIHLRGTDKYTEMEPIKIEDICSVANKCAEKIPGCQFFVCTDELSLLTRAKELLNGKIITYDSYRSTDGTSVHLHHRLGQSQAKIGEDIIIEALLMSRCDLFIHTLSNVALGILYLNPKLKTMLLLPSSWSTLHPSLMDIREQVGQNGAIVMSSERVNQRVT